MPSPTLFRHPASRRGTDRPQTSPPPAPKSLPFKLTRPNVQWVPVSKRRGLPFPGLAVKSGPLPGSWLGGWLSVLPTFTELVRRDRCWPVLYFLFESTI